MPCASDVQHALWHAPLTPNMPMPCASDGQYAHCMRLGRPICPCNVPTITICKLSGLVGVQPGYHGEHRGHRVLLMAHAEWGDMLLSAVRWAMAIPVNTTCDQRAYVLPCAPRGNRIAPRLDCLIAIAILIASDARYAHAMRL